MRKHRENWTAVKKKPFLRLRFALNTTKSAVSTKNLINSFTSLSLPSFAAAHLSSTLPVRIGSSNTRRKSFPGLESVGEIRAVEAHQRAGRTISRWENRRALSRTAHVGKRNRGHAGLCAADLPVSRTGLDIENVP